VVLSSGRVSDYYLDGRKITLHPEGAYLVASLILDLVGSRKNLAIGGPTLGADPIVGAVVALSYIRHRPLKGFIVRRRTKTYGLRRQIEGPFFKKRSRVVLVDDVATTGESLIQAKRLLDKEGIKVDCAIVVVDRQEGADENLKRVGLKLISIFKKEDFF
jgi:orotate phosphoribosyltransferase